MFSTTTKHFQVFSHRFRNKQFAATISIKAVLKSCVHNDNNFEVNSEKSDRHSHYLFVALTDCSLEELAIIE